MSPGAIQVRGSARPGLDDGQVVRVLFLSNLFPTPAEPARGMFNAQLAEQMASLCDLNVVVPLPWFPDNPIGRWLAPRHARIYGGIPARQMRAGIDVHYARYPLIPGAAEYIHSEVMQLGIAGLIKRLHRRHSFDAMLALWLYPDAVAAHRVVRALHIPAVLTALGSDVNSMMAHRVRRRAILNASRRAAAITVVSPQLATKLASHGVDPARIVTITNGVDTEKFRRRERAACRSRLSIPVGRKTIVCVARLSPEKGLAVLINAMPAVLRRFPDAQLFVLGEGAQRSELEQLCTQLGCAAAVNLIGAVAHDLVPFWWAAADVGCLPSFREGHPNALMESLSCGVPMVASAVGSVPDYVSDATGLLVPPGDWQALSEGLLTALERDWNQDTIAASVGSRSWKVVAREYMAVLQRAVET